MPQAPVKPQPTNRADGKTAVADQMARALETRLDGETIYTPNPLKAMAPSYYIYLFSLYPEALQVPKGSLGTVRIPACPVGAKHSPPYRLPAVVSTAYFDAASQSMKTDDMRGEFVAQDIVHPFLGGDWSEGQNMEDYGVFWTLNEHPTEAELAAARGKLEAMLRRQLQAATTLETTNRLEFISPTMRRAATYFGEDRAWNRTYKKIADCPGCGEPAKPGIIRHTCGYIFDYDRAIALGWASVEDAQALGVALSPETLKRAAKAKTPGGPVKPATGQ